MSVGVQRQERVNNRLVRARANENRLRIRISGTHILHLNIVYEGVVLHKRGFTDLQIYGFTDLPCGECLNPSKGFTDLRIYGFTDLPCGGHPNSSIYFIFLAMVLFFAFAAGLTNLQIYGFTDLGYLRMVNP
jgi:hypothetical protein